VFIPIIKGTRQRKHFRAMLCSPSTANMKTKRPMSSTMYDTAPMLPATVPSRICSDRIDLASLNTLQQDKRNSANSNKLPHRNRRNARNAVTPLLPGVDKSAMLQGKKRRVRMT
jgi:hypothetical protein